MVSDENSTIDHNPPQINRLIWHKPKTFESVQMPAKRMVKFKMAKHMRKNLNGQSQQKIFSPIYVVGNLIYSAGTPSISQTLLSEQR
jgi:hypothetical protein